MPKPHFDGAFSYLNADALYAFKSRGFGGEIGLVTVNYLSVLTSSEKVGALFVFGAYFLRRPNSHKLVIVARLKPFAG